MEPLRLSFDHDTDSASLRRTALHQLVRWQSPELAEDALLVITELVQNVIQHTGDGGELAISRNPEAVLVEVSDSSREEPRMYPPDPRRVGGRGMLVVASLSRTWGSRPTTEGKIVWAELPLPAAESG
jgi:anti-sigma regulatory factor (Ser/Thr protein kinase)